MLDEKKGKVTSDQLEHECLGKDHVDEEVTYAFF